MRTGFTLAEVLITLGIIGVVAAMTIPILLGEYKKYVNVVTLRKAYSDIERLFLDFRAETDCYGYLNDCFPEDGQFRDEFAKYLYSKKGFRDKFTKRTQIEVNLLGTPPVAHRWLIAYNPINLEGDKLLVAPGGAYILGFRLNTRDNYYQLMENGEFFTPPNYFRAKIDIYTDSSMVNDIRGEGLKKVPTIGREIFYLFIMADGQIIPNGSSKCGGGGSWHYDCQDVTANPLLCDPTYQSQNLNNGSLCFGKIITDGWQMKY